MMIFSQRWLPGLTLLAWASVLLIFSINGQVKSLLTPVFRPWVVVAGVLLAAMAIALFFARKPAGSCCDGEHEHEHDDGHEAGHDHAHGITRSLTGRLLTFAILIVPIVAAASFSPDSYSASTVRNRGLVEDASGLGKRIGSLEPPLPTKDGGPAMEETPGSVLDYMEKTPEGFYRAEVVDFVFAADEPDLRNALDGQTVAVIGQVLEESQSNAQGNRFKLMRMFMMCCAADARPVGLAVETDALPDIPEMSWVRVVARASFPLEGGKSVPVLQAVSVEKVAPPEESMLF